MGLRVTDHALMRFLERAGDATLEPLRAQMEAGLARAAEAAALIGVDQYLIVTDELTYVVRDGAVVTIVGPTTPHGRARMLRARSE